jgi:hypothetical protein
MRRTFRRLRGRHGVTARRVAVRASRPWYWRLLIPFVALAVGYALAYWQLSNGEHFQAAAESEQVHALVAQLVSAERRLQVEHAAQSNLAKEISSLQDEMLTLKEEVAFYKSVLTESATPGVLKLHSVKLTKGSHPGEYRYHILLVQSGSHDKMAQGKLQLILQAAQNGKAVTQHVEPPGQQHGIVVSFKYYQRIDGIFNVPAGMQGQSLLVELSEPGDRRPKMTQSVNLPT